VIREETGIQDAHIHPTFKNENIVLFYSSFHLTPFHPHTNLMSLVLLSYFTDKNAILSYVTKVIRRLWQSQDSNDSDLI
jgi:hypothetical protein